MSKNQKHVTIYGHLSFPKFTHKEAVEWNKQSQWVNSDPSKVSPEFSLLVGEAQLKKFRDHLRDVFIPWAVERGERGEKRNVLTAAQAKRIKKLLDSGDWEDQPPFIPIKTVHKKTAEMLPEAKASIKIKGFPGQDIELRAIVRDESELAVPDPDILQYPIIKGVQETVHQQIDAGDIVAATIDMYAYVSSGLPGITANASVAVFKEEGVRFGGGTDVDEDAIFMD